LGTPNKCSRKTLRVKITPTGASVSIFQVYERSELPERNPPAEDTRAFLLKLNSRAMEAFDKADVAVESLVPLSNGKIGEIHLYYEKPTLHLIQSANYIN
jgi:hypothetical protein